MTKYVLIYEDEEIKNGKNTGDFKEMSKVIFDSEQVARTQFENFEPEVYIDGNVVKKQYATSCCFYSGEYDEDDELKSDLELIDSNYYSLG